MFLGLFKNFFLDGVRKILLRFFFRAKIGRFCVTQLVRPTDFWSSSFVVREKFVEVRVCHSWCGRPTLASYSELLSLASILQQCAVLHDYFINTEAVKSTHEEIPPSYGN